jgi:hypothetical protein
MKYKLGKSNVVLDALSRLKGDIRTTLPLIIAGILDALYTKAFYNIDYRLLD